MIDQLFSREFAGMPGSDSQSLIPNVNILEAGSGYTIEVAAPGLKKEDFIVQLEKNRLVISARQKQDKEEAPSAARYLKKEFSYQSFSRQFSLPETVNKDAIKASYDNGVLKVELPKAEKTENAVKSISIA